MKFLFLDVDGVLNSGNNDFGSVEKDKLDRVKTIVKETDAKVVLSSSWRFGEDCSENSNAKRQYDNLISSLNTVGIEVYSQTPKLPDGRGYEIQKWLLDSIEKDGIRVEGFAILDDEEAKYLYPMDAHLVQTDSDIGLTDKEMFEAIRFINENEDNRPSMFFITCFEKVGLDKLGWLDTGAERVFGFVRSFREAKDDLNNNNCDMHEYLYNYAIVEEMKPCIHPEVINAWYFKWDEEKNGFFEIEKPKEFDHFCNISLG